MPRRSARDVENSRVAAIEAGVDLASVEGMEGITIGRLAAELGMSKSGLIGRFGSKEELQLAVLESAVARFTTHVWLAAADAGPGLPRLHRVVDAWVDHLAGGVFPGGCFVTTASVEYDARPGIIRDRVAATVDRWLRTLEAEARIALEAGDLSSDRDPADVAFELHSLASGGGVASRLTDTPAGLERLRGAMHRTLR
ncbi:MAG: TetR/AcrR family transcriptional regulator [Patulibacter minatonensis]